MEKGKVAIYKKWWLWTIIVVVAIILLFVILFMLKIGGVGSAGISKAEFDEIIVGETTNFELSSIIDKDDKWNNDFIYNRCVEKISEEKEYLKYTYTYKYYGEKGGYAIITLQSDYTNGNFYNPVVVIKKENFDLK